MNLAHFCWLQTRHIQKMMMMMRAATKILKSHFFHAKLPLKLGFFSVSAEPINALPSYLGIPWSANSQKMQSCSCSVQNFMRVHFSAVRLQKTISIVLLNTFWNHLTKLFLHFKWLIIKLCLSIAELQPIVFMLMHSNNIIGSQTEVLDMVKTTSLLL